MTIHSVIIQKLLSTNAHLGKRAAAHHFKIFTSGVRDGVSIIDSDKTLICLRNATNFIGQLAREKNARFLFVNTNPLFDEIVEQMTKKIGLYSPRDKIIWKMGGFLTNSFSPKKFRSRNKKVCFAPVQPPDCVVVLDTDRKSSVILEAARLQVPIVALVDSNLPRDYYEKIAYPIPANDSMEFVYLFCNIITKTFLLERKKMREANGDTVEDEPSISSKELGKEFQRSEQSKSITRTSSATDEVLVVPYESLVPILEDSEETKQILDKLVVVKLNSTLGTAVGFNGPKSMIDVRDGVTSLDLLVNQIQNLNQKYGSDIPLVLINSARTHDDTSKVLEQYSTSNIDILPVQQCYHWDKKNNFHFDTPL
ncbi:Ribosomal protein S2, mitochondrial [Linum grandiflorum]